MKYDIYKIVWKISKGRPVLRILHFSNQGLPDWRIEKSAVGERIWTKKIFIKNWIVDWKP
jgi:hypothetical protein